MCRLLGATRLLTLTGAGGSGKTRLAAEVAHASARDYPDGIIWIELAPLSDAGLLPNHVLASLGAEQGARAPLAAVIETLRGRQSLLVLDNCEHLVDAIAAMAESLLLECPTLRVLATSREALGVGGERAWLVPGLALPSSDDAVPAKIAASPAVRLFVDRAQAALATFTLDASNAVAVAQICHRLDGLPLAIELAAARVRALPAEQLARRLDDAFHVLTSGARTAVSRHRTLRAAIDWSYALLDERERVLLQRLSVFAGDFTLAAAEEVAAGVGIDAGDVLDEIGSLVDKSLVGMREEGGHARYHLLETIRQYGAAALEQTGDHHEYRRRHARAYAALVATAAPLLITAERPQWVRRLQREVDNIRVALAWTRDNDPSLHLEIAGNLCWFWYSSGFWSEGRRWLEGALSMATPAMPPRPHATALLAAGVIASLQGDTKTAIPWLSESATLFARARDESGEAYALAYQGVSFGQTGDGSAVAPTERAMAWFRRSHDLYGLRLCLVVLSTYYAVRGDIECARAFGEEGVAVARAYGLDRELAIALQVQAGVSLASGDLTRAGQLYRESLLALRRDMSVFWTARGMQLLAFVISQLGEMRRFAFLMGAAEAVREKIGAGLFGHDRDRLEAAIDRARESLGVDDLEAEWKRGRAASLDDVLQIAIDASALVNVASAPARSLGKSADAPLLEVRALGRLEIVRDGAPLSADAWRYARPRELLLYLLAHPDGRTREQIGLVFWPEATPTQLKNSFHVTLHHLRKALGHADLIAFDKDRYQIAWDAGVRFDAREFEELVTPAIRSLRAKRDVGGHAATDALVTATALYRGDFLSEESAGDWHLETRDRLRGLFVDAQMAIGEHHLRRGAAREAAIAFNRVTAVDELNEEAYRRLMMALDQSGHRTEGLRLYERLARLLRGELDSEPNAATKALYDRLRKGEAV